MIDNKRIIKMFSCLAIIICSILVFSFNFELYTIQNSYTILAIFTTIELIVFLFVNTKLNKSLINFAFIYAICLFVFNFGQIILFGFFYDSCEHLTIVLRYFNDLQALNSLKIINFIVTLTYIGMLLAIKTKDLIVPTNENEETYEALKTKAKLIILLTFPIKIIIDTYLLYIGITSGFDSSKEALLSIPDTFVTIGNFSVIGFCLLLYVYKKDLSKQRNVFIFLIVYTLIMMLTGRRSISVAYICIYAYIYLSNRKINFKKGILVAIVGLLGLTFLNSIVYMRLYSANIIDSFIFTLKNKNIVFETLREYGNTIYPSLIVIVRWLPFKSPVYGLSYIGGLSAIFPNVGGIFGKITHSTNFGYILQHSNVLYSQYYNIGGSNVGELIFNFGIYGAYAGSFLVGIIIGKISSKANNFITNSCSYKSVYYFQLMCCLLYWIRDYFSGFTREIAWGFIFFYIINKFYKRLERKQ